MKHSLIVLIIGTLFSGTAVAGAPAQVVTQQVTVAGACATFYLRGTNLVYERVGYQLNGPLGGLTNSWVERFYYKGELVFRRVRTENEVTETALGAKGISIFQGQNTAGLREPSSGILLIREIGGSINPTGPGWVPSHEIFSLGKDQFYHLEDPMQLLYSSRVWPVDTTNPTVDKPVVDLRMRLLSGK